MATANPVNGGCAPEAATVAAFCTQTSELFSLNLSVQQVVPDRYSPMILDSATSDGVTVGQATFPALACVNLPTARCKKKIRYFAYFTNQKHIVTAEGRRPFYLQPKEMVFLSTAEAWKLQFSRPYRIETFAIDGELLRDMLPGHEELVARPLALPFNLQNVINGLIQSAHSISKAGCFDDAALDLARSFLNTLSLVRLSERPGEAAVAGLALETRRQQIKAYINQNLANPDLTIASIARKLSLSSRYIQMIFATDDTSPAEYLRQRRLESGAHLLADPKQRSLSITDIAFSCGFNSSAHFATQFRKVYGTSPRDFRLRTPVQTA